MVGHLHCTAKQLVSTGFPSRETSWAGSRHGRLVWSVQFMHPHNIVACDINNTYFHNPKGGSRTPGTLPWLRPCSQCCRAGPNLCILSTSVDIMHELEIRRLSRCRENEKLKVAQNPLQTYFVKFWLWTRFIFTNHLWKFHYRFYGKFSSNPWLNACSCDAMSCVRERKSKLSSFFLSLFIDLFCHILLVLGLNTCLNGVWNYHLIYLIYYHLIYSDLTPFLRHFWSRN